MMARVKGFSQGHPVAEVFLIGWAFAYMIEGASGFGTPVALAAPMLVSLGHPAVESITCCLIMNTLATVYATLSCWSSANVLHK
jgi:lactate permease